MPGRSGPRTGSTAGCAIAAGECRNLVAVKLDRLFRDTADACFTVAALDKLGVSLHVIDMGGASLDTRSAIGKSFLQIAAVFAELERNLISERVAAAMQKCKADGRITGSVPYGFKRVPGTNRIKEDPGEQETIAIANIYRDQGLSLREVGVQLSKRGIHPRGSNNGWAPQQVKNLIAAGG